MIIKPFLDEGSNPVLARVDDDFWDYDRQVDLEAFSTKQLFSDLSNQSQCVISTIDSQNEQVCSVNYLALMTLNILCSTGKSSVHENQY